jgi:hypothetical protein
MAVNGSANRINFPPGRQALRVCLPLVFALAATALSAGAGPADAPAAGEEPGNTGQGPAAPMAADRVEILEVRPAAYRHAVLMPDAQIPAPPPATDETLRRDWWAAQQTATDAESAVGEPMTVVLGAAQPAALERAYLVLTRPRMVHPEATIEFDGDSGGVAALRLQVAAGQSYLLDFAVSSLGPGEYAITADSVRKAYADPAADSRHLLVGLRAAADGWTTVRLERSGSGFHLHSVSVTGDL